VSTRYNQNYLSLATQPLYVANTMPIYQSRQQGFNQAPLTPNDLYQQGQKREMNLKSNQGQGKIQPQREISIRSKLCPIYSHSYDLHGTLAEPLENNLIVVGPPNPLQPPNPKTTTPMLNVIIMAEQLAISQKGVRHLSTRCNP